ncbi:MAG: hypothetical protein V3V00_07045 [Saprospiraceae bacterium]
MKYLPRILMFFSVLGLTSLFFFPMWRITLGAPQYPEGVTMYIHIDKIGGSTPSTLQNINILNHYVGMKYIEPESIPELVYFPYIVYGLIGLALLCILINDRRLYLAWGVTMVILAIAGIYDFYLWEYDYGHDLSPTAPIKVPGASFQPPVIGTKLILNFVAESYPHIAGYFTGIGILFSFLAWKIKLKIDNNEKAFLS